MATVSGLSVCKECSCVLEEKHVKEGKCPECHSVVREQEQPLPKTEFAIPVPLDVQRQRKIEEITKLEIDPAEKEEKIKEINRQYSALMSRVGERYILEWLKEVHLLMKFCMFRSKDGLVLGETVAHAKQIGKIGAAIEEFKAAIGKGRGEEL